MKTILMVAAAALAPHTATAFDIGGGMSADFSQETVTAAASAFAAYDTFGLSFADEESLQEWLSKHNVFDIELPDDVCVYAKCIPDWWVAGAIETHGNSIFKAESKLGVEFTSSVTLQNLAYSHDSMSENLVEFELPDHCIYAMCIPDWWMMVKGIEAHAHTTG